MALIICSIFVPIITIKICPKEEKILILSNFYSINPSKWPKLYNIVRKGRNFAQFWSHCSCSRHQKLSNWPQCPTYNKQITRVCLNLDTNAWLFDFPVKLAAILFKQQRRHLLLMAIFLGAKKLNEFQFGDFYCLSLLLFCHLLPVIVLIDFRSNSFGKNLLKMRSSLCWCCKTFFGGNVENVDRFPLKPKQEE